MIKFALDIDGVIANTEPPLKKAIERRYGIAPDSYEHSGVYHNMYQFEDEDMTHAVRETVNYYFHHDPTGKVYADAGVMIENAYVFLQYKPHLGCYITRRPEMYREVTQYWLDRHGFPSRPLFHVERGTCKSEKLKELGIDIIIEDSPYEINSCVSNDMKVIVIDHPYNKAQLLDCKDSKVIRAYGSASLENILTQVLSESRSKIINGLT